MFLIALPFYTYAVFGMMRWTGEGLSDPGLRFWAGTFVIFFLIAQHFRMSAIYEHLGLAGKVVPSIGRGIRNGFVSFHRMLPGYLLILIPVAILFSVERFIFTGNILLTVNVATLAIVLAWGRGLIKVIAQKAA